MNTNRRKPMPINVDSITKKNKFIKLNNYEDAKITVDNQLFSKLKKC